jgi:formylglycine-generating enzyme
MSRTGHLILAALLVCAAAAIAGEASPPGMARIPAGVFRPLFRARNAPPLARVKSFELDILPVTNADFLEFVRANPGWRRSQVKRIFADESYLKHWQNDLELGTNAPANAPVTFVSWFAARSFAQWKGKRLPTMAEWERAASAGYTQADGDQDAVFKRDVRQWYDTPAAAQLAAAGSGQANFWGVRDLHGLVWEWVADFGAATMTGDSRSASGPDREAFCGAGSLGAKDVENYPAFMRYGFRNSLKADYSLHLLGFRCAKD